MSFRSSVGDFIGGVELIVSIGNALRDSVGSAKHFKTLIVQLRSFETALFFVRRCAEQHEQDGGMALNELVRHSRRTIDDTFDQLDEYQAHLGPAPKVHKSRIKDSISKIKFALFKQDDIAKWENKTMDHSLSIIIMLTTYVGKYPPWLFRKILMLLNLWHQHWSSRSLMKD
jgi:hypothetical protein